MSTPSFDRGLSFDHDSLDAVASILIKINSSCYGRTVESLSNHMQTTAYQVANKWPTNAPPRMGFVATFGYILTFYQGYDGETIRVRASVTDHMVMTYMESVERKLDAIRALV